MLDLQAIDCDLPYMSWLCCMLLDPKAGCVLRQAAQAVLVPVLVDRQRCDAATTEAVKNMMLMNPPSALSVWHPLHVKWSSWFWHCPLGILHSIST